jgi:hypothetical protein
MFKQIKLLATSDKKAQNAPLITLRRVVPIWLAGCQ